MAFKERVGFGNLMNSKEFQDPFHSYSKKHIPTDLYAALDFCQMLACSNPLYLQVTKRTSSYFITDLTFKGSSGDNVEREDFRAYATNTLQLLDFLQKAGEEYFVYGNSFARIHWPFKRCLVDTRNGGWCNWDLNAFPPEQVQFDLNTMKYTVPDYNAEPNSDGVRPTVEMDFIDRRVMNRDLITLRHIDPRRMMIQENWVSGKKNYIWRFEEQLISDVKRGILHQVNEMPRDMLLAVKNDQDFAFNDGTIFHFTYPFISGISYQGWGVPHILLNYASLYQMQVYRSINEAVGLDYILPTRVISPSQGSIGVDAASTLDLAQWNRTMREFKDLNRRDRTALFASPIPLTYQELGGNGKSLVMHDLLAYQEASTLDAMGFPSELFKSTMAWQQMPSAIRMFESSYIHLYRSFNNFVRFVCRDIFDYLEMPRMDVELLKPSVADDMEKKNIVFQLAAGGEISRETAYKYINVDNPVNEIRKRTREDIDIQRVKMEENANFEREQTLGSAGQYLEAAMQGQQQGPPGSGVGGSYMGMNDATPMDIMAQASAKASELLQIPDVGERSKMLRQIAATDPQMHALVKQEMEKIRQAASSDAVASLSQGG